MKSDRFELDDGSEDVVGQQGSSGKDVLPPDRIFRSGRHIGVQRLVGSKILAIDVDCHSEWPSVSLYIDRESQFGDNPDLMIIRSKLIWDQAKNNS